MMILQITVVMSTKKIYKNIAYVIQNILKSSWNINAIKALYLIIDYREWNVRGNWSKHIS